MLLSASFTWGKFGVTKGRPNSEYKLWGTDKANKRTGNLKTLFACETLKTNAEKKKKG